MNYLKVTVETYAGEYSQADVHIAKVDKGQNPAHVADAVAKNKMDGNWDSDCKGFNTDCYFYHRVQGFHTITEKDFENLLGFVPCDASYTDDELAEIQTEMEG